MSTTLPKRSGNASSSLQGGPPEELRSGDRMTREEFHRVYLQTPEHFKAELIGGIVYVASPVSRHHGRPHFLLNYAMVAYSARTPGVEGLNNSTIFLDDDSEPQPDLSLRILPEHGGQSSTTPDGSYVVGAPELVIEVAYSSRSVDLHAKRDDYARCGVKEYVVWMAKDDSLAWFDLAQNVERPLSSDGIVRSIAFPGLWLDSNAIRDDDLARLTAALEAGLATPEHAAFVQRLADSKR
ncbi:MAG: Uma2 family endonuclease [Planctomycetota bacterium]|nr:Uma2 family endonuclease [Planctomycetaceae bacterium]MDQ3329701.1 Uma2 family endonuclease [Planctomycetota bacterium]